MQLQFAHTPQTLLHCTCTHPAFLPAQFVCYLSVEVGAVAGADVVQERVHCLKGRLTGLLPRPVIIHRAHHLGREQEGVGRRGGDRYSQILMTC